MLANGSWECMWHLGAHHSKGQTADRACGAGLASQLHHKLSLCELSKDMQNWRVLGGIF